MMKTQPSTLRTLFGRARFRAALGVGGGFLLGSLFWAAWSRSEPRPTRDAAPHSTTRGALQTPIAVEPRRSASAEPKDVAPPMVPENYEIIRPMLLRLETTTEEHGRVFRQRKWVARSSQYVTVKPEGATHEWWFARNQSDPRRVAGTLVEHQRRVLVEYDESELRTLGIARGWLDVVSLGMGSDPLKDLLETGISKDALGLTFREWSAKDASSPVKAFVSWNSTHALPLQVRSRTESGGTEQRLLELRLELDPAVFRDPRERFPEYRAMDIADYREKHHDAEPDQDHAGSVHATSVACGIAGTGNFVSCQGTF